MRGGAAASPAPQIRAKFIVKLPIHRPGTVAGRPKASGLFPSKKKRTALSLWSTMKMMVRHVNLRKFHKHICSKSGGGRRGVCAPPPTHTPAFRGPPKRRSAPLAAAVVRFLATVPLVRGRTFSKKSDFYSTSHLSRAASLPGAELFLKNRTSFGTSHLSRAASLPGVELFL